LSGLSPGLNGHFKDGLCPHCQAKLGKKYYSWPARKRCLIMDSNKSNWSNRLFSKTTKEPKLNQPRKTSWHSLGRHGVGVRCVALSSDRQLALLSYEKGTLDLCEVEMGQSVKTFPASGAPVCSLALHTEGSLALSGHEDGSILTLDLSTGKGEPMLEKHLAPVAALSLSLDARFVFSGAVRDSSFKM